MAWNSLAAHRGPGILSISEGLKSVPKDWYQSPPFLLYDGARLYAQVGSDRRTHGCCLFWSLVSSFGGVESRSIRGRGSLLFSEGTLMRNGRAQPQTQPTT